MNYSFLIVLSVIWLLVTGVGFLCAYFGRRRAAAAQTVAVAPADRRSPQREPAFGIDTAVLIAVRQQPDPDQLPNNPLYAAEDFYAETRQLESAVSRIDQTRDLA